jgi:hypothetical protein
MAVLCLVVASCDKDTSLLNVADDNAIGFQTMVETTTRADQTDLERDGFSVWGGYVTSGAINNVFTGTTISYDAVNGWTYSPAKYWVPGKVYNFFATYPVQATNKVTPFISSTDSKLYYTFAFNMPANADTDLLVASTPISTNTKPYGPVHFDFIHALSKININVQKNGANSDEKVVVNSIVIRNVKRSSSFNNETGKWAAGEDGMNFTSTGNLNVELQVDDSDEKKPISTSVISGLLFIPQDIAANSIQVAINYSFVEGNTVDRYTAEAFLPNTTIAKWESQKAYTYNIILGQKKNDILFGIPTVSGWIGTEQQAGSTIIIQ